MGSYAAIARTVNKARSTIHDSKQDSGETYPPALQQTLEAIAYLEEDEAEQELIEQTKARFAQFDRAIKDLEFRGAEFEKCRKSAAYFLKTWCWTYDPRRSPSTIPFNLFQKQEDYLYWLTDRIKSKECGIVEKSRDMGLTWLCAGFAVWQLIFVPGSKVTFGSRKQDLVDKLGDTDSIFQKMRQLLETLPLWLRPKDYSDNLLKIINNDNGSIVTGESGDNMGRGGRSRIYFLDEFAFVARAKNVDAAVSNNADVRIYVSTPNGDGNVFAKKRFSGKLPAFRFHWLEDPRKNGWYVKNSEGEIVARGNGHGAPNGAIYPWYIKQKDTLDPVVLAQEVDIDYAASKVGVTIPNAWIMAAINLKLNPIGDRVAGLDIADEGGDLNVLIIRRGPVVKLEDIESWSEGNTTQTAYRARNILEFKKVRHLNYDANGCGAGVGGTLNSAEDLRFTLTGIMGGAGVGEKFYSEYNRKAKDMFKNLRAESWWNMRRRFEKTYEHVNKIKEHPLSELISIPNHTELISQLGQPEWRFNDKGQIVIEGKPEMAKRGVKSPDFADALVYTFTGISSADNLSWIGKA
ncbi:terminase [Leptolyngbya sp. FACHB-541]|uniref:terminase n=1 Tax=Leptolyngbya sp. FACHB-541 TaxID=2692810 RepID=UPI00168A13CD|nr:terminase [Leptolyngbya sp. FACHB-541]MBD1995333.1 terminase [Leptolyngbya sp. FACHB-541]